VKLTVSIGVASYAHAVDGIETLMKHADRALYAAKQQGRNRSVLYEETLELAYKVKDAG